MNAPAKFRITLYLLGFAGAALFTVLLIRQGVMSVGAAVAAAGWAIDPLVCSAHPDWVGILVCHCIHRRFVRGVQRDDQLEFMKYIVDVGKARSRQR
jgi:hypothetical protein